MSGYFSSGKSTLMVEQVIGPKTGIKISQMQESC